MSVRTCFALVVTVGVTGCASSSYRVADSPRVTLVDEHGLKVYKNGKKYDDLVEAVADNPRALAEARTARSMTVTSNWLILGALSLDVASVPVAAVGIAEHDKTLGWTAFGMLGAALVADIVGFVVARNATPHVLDAINIYNDDVEAKMFVRRPTPAPTGTPAAPAP
jgi:hypothetical protein